MYEEMDAMKQVMESPGCGHQILEHDHRKLLRSVGHCIVITKQI